MKKGVKKCIISILIILCIILIAVSVSAAPACFSGCNCANWPSKNMPTCGSWITGCCKITSGGTYTLGNNLFGAYTVDVPDYDSDKHCKFTCLKIDASGVTLNLNNKKIQTNYGWYPSSDAWADDAYAIFVRSSNVLIKDGTLDRYHYPIVITGYSGGNVRFENVLFKNGPGFETSRNIRDISSSTGSNKLTFSNTNGLVKLTGSIGANRYSGTVGLNNGVIINSNSISVEGSSGWAHYWSSSSAHIEFYGISGITNPVIKKNGANCGTCNNVQQSGTTVSFDINPLGTGTPVFTVVSGCKNNGATCTANSQCCGNQCVDGVCCNTACNSLCQRCDSYDGTAGVCHFIGNNHDPNNECDAINTCYSNCDAGSQHGNCNGLGACQAEEFSLCMAGTSCQAASGVCEVTAEQCDGVDNDCDLIVDEGIPYICENNAFFTIDGTDYCFDCNTFSSRAEANTSCQSYGMSLASYADGETKQDVVDIIEIYDNNIKDLQPIVNPTNNVKKGMFIEDDCCEIAKTSNSECRSYGYPDNVGIFPRNDANLFWDSGSPGVGCADIGVMDRMVHDGTAGNANGRLNDGCQNCGAVCEELIMQCEPGFLIGSTRSCYNGPIETESIGICINGTETCQADGTWTSCIGEVIPQTESIASGNCGDGLNNDCDLEQDWDYSDFIHGEEDCPIRITAISIGSPPN